VPGRCQELSDLFGRRQLEQLALDLGIVDMQGAGSVHCHGIATEVIGRRLHPRLAHGVQAWRSRARSNLPGQHLSQLLRQRAPTFRSGSAGRKTHLPFGQPLEQPASQSSFNDARRRAGLAENLGEVADRHLALGAERHSRTVRSAPARYPERGLASF